MNAGRKRKFFPHTMIKCQLPNFLPCGITSDKSGAVICVSKSVRQQADSHTGNRLSSLWSSAEIPLNEKAEETPCSWLLHSHVDTRGISCFCLLKISKCESEYICCLSWFCQRWMKNNVWRRQSGALNGYIAWFDQTLYSNNATKLNKIWIFFL